MSKIASGDQIAVVERADGADQHLFGADDGRGAPAVILDVLQVLLRWRWLFLGIVATTVLAAAAWALLQTPLYRASATLELNPAPARVVKVGDVDEPRQSDRDFLALQIGLMKSRDLAERVARTLKLGGDERFLGYRPERPTTDAAIGPLQANLSATGTASDRIVQVSFVHADPVMAAKVTNAFADQAVEASFDRAFESTARSRRYLQRQLESTRDQLERSERQLIGYARRANIVNVVSEGAASSADAAGGTLLASNLVALNGQLAQAQDARIVAEQRAAQAQASARSAVAADGTVQALQQQRAVLQTEREQMQQRYRPDHPERVRLEARLGELSAQIKQASARAGGTVIEALQAEFVSARNREAVLRGQIKQLEEQLLDLNDKGVQYTLLRRAVDANRSLYNALLAKLGEENTNATRSSSVAIIDQAQVPGAPFSPNLARTLVLGLLGGVVLGCAGCLGIDRLRNTLERPEDLRGIGLPILGVVPKLATAARFEDELMNSNSALAEAYHSIRASLQFAGEEGVPRSIMLTSSRAEEGKTSSVIALAADFVRVGMRVVVVDADLRRPSLRSRRKDGGLHAILAGESTLERELNESEAPGLYLVHAGTIPSDPTVLLASRAFADLISRLEREFDVVLIDSPPVLGLADAPLISSVARATVLVVEAGQTHRAAATSALGRLRDADGRIIGGIMTKLASRPLGYDGYAYGYNYQYGGDDQNRWRSLIAPAARTARNGARAA